MEIDISQLYVSLYIRRDKWQLSGAQPKGREDLKAELLEGGFKWFCPAMKGSSTHNTDFLTPKIVHYCGTTSEAAE